MLTVPKLDTGTCYTQGTTYLGKYISTESYYPDGRGRGGYTKHTFEKGTANGSESTYNNYAPAGVTVVPCKEGGKRRSTRTFKRRAVKTRRRRQN